MTGTPATPDPQSPLSEFINTAPRTARVFESFGLDYCCHGQRPLGDACDDAGVRTEAVLAALGKAIHEEASGTADDDTGWLELDPGQLALHIESVHHVYLHDEMPRLDALADKVTDVHGERHRELYDVRGLFRELRAELTPHLLKEEQVLFPMIRELVATGASAEFHCGSLRNPISVMLSEHDDAGDLLARLRKAANGYEPPADGCASYRALYEGLAELERDTHLHIHKENNVLFPAVVELESRERTSS